MRGEELVERYKIGFAGNAEAAKTADVVILSVKPQRLAAVMKDLRGVIPPASAGHLDHRRRQGCRPADRAGSPRRRSAPCPTRRPRSARASPCGPPRLRSPRSSASWHRQILSALGEEIFVEDENYLDMATALSGTGPAYVFLFMEAMIDAGVHLGFPRRIAEQLVIQTLRGSVDYYAGRKQHAASLRNEVTSPGRHLGRGALLPGKGRLPHRHLARGVGCLRAQPGAGCWQGLPRNRIRPGWSINKKLRS